jgi:chromosome segregation ATPase
MVRELNEIKASQKVEITKLMDDNRNLSKICQDQDKQIKNLDSDRIKLLSRNDELNFEVKNLSGKLKSKEENLGYNQRQLDEAKSQNFKLSNTLKDYEKQIDLQRTEIASLNAANQKERAQRLDSEKSNEHLQILLNERDREINRLVNDLETSRAVNQRVSEEKLKSNSDNDRLKNHIIILTEQNEKVCIRIYFITLFYFILFYDE